MRPKFALLILFPLFIFTHGVAQPAMPGRLKVFIDCHSGCDMNYIRTEINIVDFLLDRIAADVHVLITDENTGSGGDKYQLIFFGQNQFSHLRDTIYFDNAANNTDFEEREFLIKYLKLGLTPFIAKTKMAKNISIQMKTDEASKDSKKDSMALKQKDPWNYWVFNTSINGSGSSEESYKNSSINGELSASRITDEYKIVFQLEAGKNKSSFEYEDDNGVSQKFTNKNDSYNFSHYLIKSITDHWSVGYEGQLSRNTFSNNKQRSQLTVGIEYNIYPYNQVNTKYFTISYRLDVRRNNYFDTTLYDKKHETLTGHGIESTITYKQKWGTVEFGLQYHNYFHNWKFFNLQAECGMDIRITGGLSFFVFTNAELIRDQIFLPKEGATPQEVLTRRRQLASGYSISAHFGLNYRFGSKLNNFVNARFGN